MTPFKHIKDIQNYGSGYITFTVLSVISKHTHGFLICYLLFPVSHEAMGSDLLFKGAERNLNQIYILLHFSWHHLRLIFSLFFRMKVQTDVLLKPNQIATCDLAHTSIKWFNAILAQYYYLFEVHYSDITGSPWRRKSPALDCLFSNLFRLTAKITSKPRGHLWMESAPHKGPEMRKSFPCRDVIMYFAWPSDGGAAAKITLAQKPHFLGSFRWRMTPVVNRHVKS